MSAALAKLALLQQDLSARKMEEALLERVRTGDRNACDTLMRRYQRSIFGLVLRYVQNEEDAKDLTQQIFLKVFEQIGKFRGESSVHTWIYRIAVNQAQDASRKQSRRLPEVLVDPPNAPLAPDVLVRKERREQLHRALESLPTKQRLVVELRLFDELPFKDIAEIMSSKEETAKMNFHHALKRLREILQTGEGGSL